MSNEYYLADSERYKEIQEKIFKDYNYQIPPASFFKEFASEDLQIFGVRTGLYTFPTLELIEFLRPWIVGKKAVEICAGYGIIGKALGIPCTDSYLQNESHVNFLYNLFQQTPINYPKEVLKISANDVIKYYNPQVVIGSFVTGTKDMHGHPLNMYGVEEDLFLDDIETYIMIGNENVHKTKNIRVKPHRVYKADWLVTKARNPQNNMIYIWSKDFVDIDHDKYGVQVYETQIDPAEMPEQPALGPLESIEKLFKEVIGEIPQSRNLY